MVLEAIRGKQVLKKPLWRRKTIKKNITLYTLSS